MQGLLDQTAEARPATYTVLARRYRSRDFDEVVGQEPIAQTLKNAIERGRTAHAYLFTGTRGVGKTSMARIFAKAINATDDLTEKEQIAEAILRGEDIDVIEIDAASNTGVDNVRDLIANASLVPARSPYKIYIIDEVHMLSKAAFNALLKVMEEPPSHVKFVLCTTEPQKVPATIQSRCQRFDFRNIPAKAIAGHLRNVVEKEQVQAEPQVVNEIARLANGSMRDGLSILDRLIAGADGNLTIAVLEAALGAPAQSLVVGVVDGILTGDPKRALEASTALLAGGTSVEQAVDVLIDHLRNVLIVATCGPESDMIEVFGEARDAAVRHAGEMDAAGVVHMIALCEATARNLRSSAVSRALFDAMIARLSMAEHLASIPDLLKSGDGRAPVAEKKNERERNVRRDGGADARGRKDATQSVARPKPATTRSVAPPSKDVAPRPKSVAPASSPTLPREEIEAARANPLVSRALELFNAEIVRVRKLEADEQNNQDNPDEPTNE